MVELELAAPAQHWLNLGLIWIGFGTVAGLLAKILLPGREPSGAWAVIILGLLGTLVGPLGLSLALGSRFRQPIGPLGLLAATGCALVLMVAYRLLARGRQAQS